MTQRTTAAILTLLIGFGAQTAWPHDNNDVFINQDGKDNAGNIEQTGVFNQLGTIDDPAHQSGYFNLLELTQSGTNNLVGAEGAGLNQNGQSATPDVFNQIVIRQKTDGNTVGEVQQSALGAIPEGANRLDITQRAGNNNRIGTVLQRQSGGMPGQTATTIQTGHDNVITRIEQQSLTPANNGENKIHAEFVGDSNGAVGLSGWALNSGATSGALIQTRGDDGEGANGNTINLVVLGDSNRFGIYQGGRLNWVRQITVVGDANQLGIRQDGFENDFTSSIIAGSGNDIGFEQWGTNTAYLDVLGQSNDNRISAFQNGANDLRIFTDGDRNDILARQDYVSGLGTSNKAEIDVTGSDNFLNLVQEGGNTAAVAISGDANNGTAFSAGGLGLAPGEVRQTGEANALTATVQGDQNMFAMTQGGHGNLAALAVSGTNNEAELMQFGQRNSASLQQSGIANRAAISQ